MVKKLFSGDYRRYTIIVLISAIVSIGLGFLFHFAFNLTGKNSFVGLFAPVNESIWEHLKIIFFPFILTMIVEYFLYGKEAYNFFSSKFIGLEIALLSVITNYYTMVGAFGINNMAINISIFVIGVFIAYVISYLRMLKTPRLAGGIYEVISISSIAIMLLLFCIFTYFPPHVPLFRDPTDMSYSVFSPIFPFTRL